MNLEGTGIDPAALRRYIDEQIYSLPGTDRPQDVFTVLLTGSRATGALTPRSDVDIDVLCPRSVYDAVHAASRAAGIIEAPRSFFCALKGDDWDRYHGREMGRPHFSLTPLEQVAKQIAEYQDVALWIWTNARTLTDPGGQFRRIVRQFGGYPLPILTRKIKYRWMLAGYWEVECYPHHHTRAEELLPAAAGILNAVNELLRFFHLVDGRPFPYTEKLLSSARGTKLGARFCPLLERAVALALGTAGDGALWDRLDRANDILCCSDEAQVLEDACVVAMTDAGVDPEWVKADFGNIEELLRGELGPPP